MSIATKIAAISEFYQQLNQANQRFIEQKDNIEAFKSLIEQRELIVEDLAVVTQELIQNLQQNFAEQAINCSNTVETVLMVASLMPELAESCAQVRLSLEELVASDQGVEKHLAGMRDEIKSEIGRIRKGSRGLRGYRQNHNYGSCFINKVK